MSRSAAWSGTGPAAGAAAALPLLDQTVAALDQAERALIQLRKDTFPALSQAVAAAAGALGALHAELKRSAGAAQSWPQGLAERLRGFCQLSRRVQVVYAAARHFHLTLLAIRVTEVVGYGGTAEERHGAIVCGARHRLELEG